MGEENKSGKFWARVPKECYGTKMAEVFFFTLN